jgi:hypothetical protein
MPEDQHYDVVIIGTGAGGRDARTPARHERRESAVAGERAVPATGARSAGFGDGVAFASVGRDFAESACSWGRRNDDELVAWRPNIAGGTFLLALLRGLAVLDVERLRPDANTTDFGGAKPRA